MFDHILNWKLLSGSHKFPGPEGGTCINEAALVAAGFEYRAVGSVRDLPKCFSRPIAQLAMSMNDGLPDDLRQNLMKYVCRLAGTADVREIEDRRESLGNQILTAGMYDVLQDMKRYDVYHDIISYYGPYIPSPNHATVSPLSIYNSILVQLSTRKHSVMYDIQERLMQIGFNALDAMLSFGNQAQPIETETVEKRFEAIKEKVNASIS